MNEAERREYIEIFSEGFESIILPHFEDIYKKLEQHGQRFEQIEQILEEMNQHFDNIESHLNRMDRKLDAVVECQDNHGVRIKNLEDKMLRQN